MVTRLCLIEGRRLFLPPIVAALAVVAVLAVACSEAKSARQPNADAPVLIDVSPTFVTIENRAGLPLVDISVAIVPYGQQAFTKVLARIENQERRDVALREFVGLYGSSFSLQAVRPKAVRVRAKDIVGKSYEVERPWHQ